MQIWMKNGALVQPGQITLKNWKVDRHDLDFHVFCLLTAALSVEVGGDPRVVVSTAAFHEFGVRFPISAVWKNQKCFFPIHVWNSVLWGASVTER